MIEAVLAVLHRMVWADGSADPREIDVGVRVAGRMLGPLIEEADVAGILAAADPPEARLEELPEEARFIVFRAAALVAQADEVIDPAEVALLEKLGKELAVEQALVDDVVGGLQADVAARKELGVLKTLAAEMLGVPPDADDDAIRARYRQLVITAVTDSDEPEAAAEVAEQMAWAYHTLIG